MANKPSRNTFLKDRIEAYNLLSKDPTITSTQLLEKLSNRENLKLNTVTGWKFLFGKGLLKPDGSAPIKPKTEQIRRDSFDLSLDELSNQFHNLKKENEILKSTLAKWKSLAGKLQEDIQTLSIEK